MTEASPISTFFLTFAQASTPTVGAAPAGAPAAPAAAAPSAGSVEVLGQPKGPIPGAPVAATTPAGTGTAAVPVAPAGGQTAQPAPSMLSFMLPMILVIGLMLVFSMMTSRKEKKKRAELFAAMAPGDKVQTYGGIIGNIAEIKEDEVVLRVDEVTNTRIRFNRSAIQGVLRKHGQAASTEVKLAGAKAGV
jgi:preprotein translocase subunit YajC